MKAGYDIELTSSLVDRVDVPVIASGGAGNLEHLFEAFSEGQAHAVLAASIFHYGEFTIAEAKAFLSELGLPMRIEHQVG
jgi:cyclase